MEDRTGNTTWDTKYMNLPEGQFIVQFFLYTSMFNYLCIDNIHIVAGICSSANGKNHRLRDVLFTTDGENCHLLGHPINMGRRSNVQWISNTE